MQVAVENELTSLLSQYLNKIQLDEVNKCSDVDGLIELSIKHKVLGLIYNQLVTRYDTELVLLNKAKMIVIKDIISQQIRTKSFIEIYKEFERNNISVIVVKGLMCRTLLGADCNSRPSCDEDILINIDDFNRVNSILLDNGYVCASQLNEKTKIENEQEITYICPDTGLHLEVHLNLMGTDDSLRRKMNSYFSHVFSTSEYYDIPYANEVIRVESMNPTDHYLYLVMHAFRHFIQGGFGIRQVIDISLWKAKYQDVIDWNYIIRTLNEINAFFFYNDLISVANDYLGFSFDLPDSSTTCPQEMLADVMYSGIYGNSSTVQVHARLIVQRVVEDHIEGRVRSRIANCLSVVFPSSEKMLQYYPEASHNKGLMFWKRIQRLFTILFSWKKHREDNMLFEVAEKRLDLLSKYKLV